MTNTALEAIASSSGKNYLHCYLGCRHDRNKIQLANPHKFIDKYFRNGNTDGKIMPPNVRITKWRKPNRKQRHLRRFKCHHIEVPTFIFKRSAKAISLDAIVDVRLRRRLRRRHEMIFFNISETVRVSDFTIYHKVALESLYISTGNDFINYFQSAANRTNVYILGHVRVVISR